KAEFGDRLEWAVRVACLDAPITIGDGAAAFGGPPSEGNVLGRRAHDGSAVLEPRASSAFARFGLVLGNLDDLRLAAGGEHAASASVQTLELDRISNPRGNDIARRNDRGIRAARGAQERNLAKSLVGPASIDDVCSFDELGVIDRRVQGEGNA